MTPDEPKMTSNRIIKLPSLELVVFVVVTDNSELPVVEAVPEVPVVTDEPVVVDPPVVDSSNRAGTFENGPSMKVSVAPIKFGLVFRDEVR